ncbi:MAG: YHYH protein [Planctomycetota bacterium]
MRSPRSPATARLFAIAIATAIAVATATGAAAQQPGPKPPQAKPFERFAGKVAVGWDARWLYVASDGMPDHEMMTAITAWQQQVPLPQPYTGDNSWRVPLQPKPAAQPKSAKTAFFRGAIAIAINGVPIFNPIKNDGRTDTYLAGELDLFGGHAGRADDYHYHLAPVFLNGGDPSIPVAYALDGYPIYGFTEPDGSPVKQLDARNGHDDPELGYHYHATREYPYLNGGFHGEVVERDGEVDPQPHAHPIREATTPLRGATVTSFAKSEDGKTYTLVYDLRGKQGSVKYTLLDGGGARFVFTLPDGTVKAGTYRGSTRRPGEGQGGGAGGGERGGGQRGNQGRGQGGEPPPPPPTSGPQAATARQPWLLAHLGEIDTDGDGTIAQAELDAECKRTLAGYDRDQDGAVSESERDAPGAGRSAMGGFVKQHWSEVDRDGDGVVAGAEIRRTAQSMFDRADRDDDGLVTTAELSEPRPQGGGGQGGGGKGYAALQSGFLTEVPAHPFDAILVRPLPTSIALSVVDYGGGEALVEYGPVGEAMQPTRPQALRAGEPTLFELTGLRPDAAHTYRLRRRAVVGKGAFDGGDERTFRTPRAPGAPFRFTVIADSHLDTTMSPPVYVQALANAKADVPDFHVDLGDTFMTDKRRDFRESAPQYDAQRWYLGLLCDQAPLFMVLGNHDGENGVGGRGADDIAGWSFARRTRMFPPPVVDGGMYSGRTAAGSDGAGHYYAFAWGSALVVALDPFWPTTERRRGASETQPTDESWSMTLGRAQYDWLAATLQRAKAPWKFVFIHHLVGGRGKASRGGAEAAPFFEWGGANADGSAGFAQRRPGWPLPIHDVLRQHGVAAVFHGHDHLYVRAERDGIVYQCVPQPGNPRGGTRTAEEYGYTSGTVLGSPGHLRVDVSPTTVDVAYVRSAVEGLSPQRAATDRNGAVVHAYQLTKPAAK